MEVFGDLHYIPALIERYPQYLMIPAHAGGECKKEYLPLAKAVKKHNWNNVYTDSAEIMEEFAAKVVYQTPAKLLNLYKLKIL